MKLKLTILKEKYSIHQFKAKSEVPKQIFESSFYSVSKTSDELSIVCESRIKVDSDQSEVDWSCIKVIGPLDFSLTGILADISAVLAQNNISIFAISTFDTDYVLVKSDKLKKAKESLAKSDYLFVD